MFDKIRPLLDVRGDPAVSIVMPLDPPRPGTTRHRIRLRNLHAAARNQVLEWYTGREAKAVLDRLDEAMAAVDLSRPGLGVVVFATRDIAEAHMAPFPVHEAVAVDSTLLTRSLIQGLRRSPRYRVLVVSEKRIRLFDAVRDHLAEIDEGGFPMQADFAPLDRRAVAGRFALEGAGDDRETLRTFYRRVDTALREICRGDPLPLVLAGVERSVARFEEVARAHGQEVIGRVRGNYGFLSSRDLGAITWPVARHHLRQRRREVVARLVKAVGEGRAVTGIDEVWRLAGDGRGNLLVVEEDYRHEPSMLKDGRLVPAPVSLGPDVITDPVDEVVESVVRSGGIVEFVPSQQLGELGRIGLLLRWNRRRDPRQRGTNTTSAGGAK